MKRENKKMLYPKEAMKRIKSAATIVAIGPSSSGKSTLIYALVNHRVVVFIAKGVGDKNQTTIIPCTFLFDERIETQHFALKIKTRKFTVKDISVEVKEQLAILFASNSACAEDTLDSIDEQWMNRILEPDTAAYHLGGMKKEISSEKFKDSIKEILWFIENMEKSFEQRVKEMRVELKNNPPKEKVKITDIRRMVFSEMWDELDANVTEEYEKLLLSIGEIVENKLTDLLGCKIGTDEIYEYSTEYDDLYQYGGKVLEELFNPYNPYSLIIDEMTLSCSPREEFLSEDDEIPVRFCLRDTMGLTQIDTQDNTITDALDIALNCSPDSILLLINLEERDDVISRSIDAITSKYRRATQMDIPLNVLYTKSDKIIDNLIYKKNRDTVNIGQKDYDEHISEAVNDLDTKVEFYNKRLMANSSSWLSLRFKDEEIDPIQISVKKNNPSELWRFTSSGLYERIQEIIFDAQRRILPNGMDSPLIVQVNNYDEPAVSFKIKSDAMHETLQEIRKKLTEDKATYNRYLITDKYRIHGRSVVNYYRNLQHGRGYKTNANVYGNFNINMKLMIYNTLCEHVPRFLSLYEAQAVSTIVENLPSEEIKKMVMKYDENKDITQFAYADINPEILENIEEKLKLSQKIHFIFRHYFKSSEKYFMVMNRVALRLSYRHPKIKAIIDNIYFKPISYDDTIREMQSTFKAIFNTDDFADIITEEIGEAMTELVNKMFVTI